MYNLGWFSQIQLRLLSLVIKVHVLFIQHSCTNKSHKAHNGWYLGIVHGADFLHHCTRSVIQVMAFMAA